MLKENLNDTLEESLKICEQFHHQLTQMVAGTQLTSSILHRASRIHLQHS